ncbi:hypothetical protein MNBD_NITROSPINAE02-2174 [hydrothermal vent metagenome]|uniref:Uncharacterized protein n=1 Tax=hydrothermal vent metagenome TaxID=652676 RepID=A0A3B1CLR0_9ZZZZ
MVTKYAVGFLLIGAILAAGVNSPAYGFGAAQQIKPAYVDRNQGFVYFIVLNKWEHTISNLFGWVYGHGNAPAAYLVNNPNQEGIKVSIGPHAPGTLALYRFQVPERYIFFPQFALLVMDKGLFHPRVIPNG